MPLNQKFPLLNYVIIYSSKRTKVVSRCNTLHSDYVDMVCCKTQYASKAIAFIRRNWWDQEILM